jgi:effector-binding domain-containing protein
MVKLVVIPLLIVVAAVVVSACTTSRTKYETATYSVSRAEGSFEIREYPALKVASTANSSPNESFMRLFRYIDGGNEKKEKISMTTPVIMADGEMNFVVPKTQQTDTPKPVNEKVLIKTLPAKRLAVYRYSGFGTKSNEVAGVQKLKTWLAENKLDYVDEHRVAYYDAPLTLPFLRRNEVMVPLK